MTMPRDAQIRQECEQPAEVLYDLFRCAPIPVIINDDKGKAAFFTREAQLAQAKLILAQVHAAGRSAGLEEAAQIAKNHRDQSTERAILKRKEEQ